MGRIDHSKMRDLLKVYFIMGSVNCSKAPEQVLKEAIAGGITVFQYREKGEGALTGVAKLELAEKLREICRVHQIPFIVNDDLELALAVDADGVHIGQEDQLPEIVREKIGSKILGVSVHSLEEAEAAVKAGADYFGVGPIYPTNTKTDTQPVQGVSMIQTIRRAGYDIPIVGIGGITVENASPVTKAGADGVAVISTITEAEDIPSQVGKLSKAVTEGVSLIERK